MAWLVTYRRKVRYSDTDAQGIVFNGNYVTYFDDTLTDLLEKLGFTAGALAAAGFDVVTANLTVDFKASATLGDVLVTGARVGRIGAKSITFELVTHIESTGVVAVEGSVVWVTVDAETFRPIEIPEGLIEALQSTGT